MATFTLPRFDESDQSPSSQGFGSLKTPHGNLPLKQLGYDTKIVGLAVSTTIRQTFYNPFNEAIEATYLFPIQGDQAVVGCQMWVGSRCIHAKLKERGQARSDYQRAIRQGHRAALLEENRPETFSMKVCNIPPGEAIQVRIQTVGCLAIAHDEWTLRLPLVVAPRYTSGMVLPYNAQTEHAISSGGTASNTNEVRDASAITPPIQLPTRRSHWIPGFANPVDLSLNVEIHPNQWTNKDPSSRHRHDFQSIRSSLHSVGLVVDEASSVCRIETVPDEKVNRDFILRGNLPSGPTSASFTIERPASNAVDHPGIERRSAMAIDLIPPRTDASVPRDIVFLLDRSGSMGGWKMAAARRGISRLIDSLNPQDRFQLLAFDNDVTSPFEIGSRGTSQLIEATDANRYEATRWLANIHERGGTEMARAIKKGLKPFQSPRFWTRQKSSLPNDDTNRSPVMVLVTDGQVTGEDSLLSVLGKIPAAQRPRIFCLGIDQAVNGSVLQRLTQFTGGTYELAESEKRLDEVLSRFGNEMGAPAITGLKLDFANSDGQSIDRETLELAPSNLNTLYEGRPVSIYCLADEHETPTVTVSGRLASGQAWSQTITPNCIETPSTLDETLRRLWGRVHVRELEDVYFSAAQPDPGLKDEITACSLEAGVLCRFTAFVAVDESERVTDSRRPHEVSQPVELPDGWRYPALPSDQLVSLRSSRTLQRQVVKPSTANSKIGDLLLQRGIIGLDQLREAEEVARSTGRDVGETLIYLQYAEPEEVSRVVAEVHSLPYLDLRTTRIAEDIIELVPESVARENHILPVDQNGADLIVAIPDPNDLETVEKLRFILNRSITIMIAPKDAISGAINQYYGQVEGESADCMLQEFTDTAIDFTETDDGYFEAEPPVPAAGGDFARMSRSVDVMDDDLDSFGEICQASAPMSSSGFTPAPRSIMRKRARVASTSDAPVVRLVNLMIAEATQLNATHILIMPDAKSIRFSYVIDGVVVEREAAPRRMLAAIVSRLKILAKLDITIKDQLQSGIVSITVGNLSIECMIHLAPCDEGTTALIELDRTSATDPEPVSQWREEFSRTAITTKHPA